MPSFFLRLLPAVFIKQKIPEFQNGIFFQFRFISGWGFRMNPVSGKEEQAWNRKKPIAMN